MGTLFGRDPEAIAGLDARRGRRRHRERLLYLGDPDSPEYVFGSPQ